MDSSQNKVRVRFAPSPTGWLHIGGLRTALYNYLFARNLGGTFILRIEDTDQKRYVEGAESDIIQSLRWSGLDFDEGPGKEGDCGPYRQSERSELYAKYARKLIDDGHAYYAFDTTQEIEEMRERLQKSGNPSPKYDAITRMSMKNSITLPAEEVEKRLESGQEYVVRLKVPRRETIRFEDMVRGHVRFESQGLDDQVLLKSDGLPTYHLANVVDDHEMGISHVIRGEEWLSSAPKHILLYQYLGWEPPTMAHLPLIMSPAGGKLSKRKAEEQGIMVNVKDYMENGFEPGALINFLAFLGWNPGDDREILSLEQLCAEFAIDRVGKAGAVFNMNKLMWYNEQYMRQRSVASLLPDFKRELDKASISCEDDAYLEQILPLMLDRVSKVSELVEHGSYFFKAPAEYDEKSLKKAWKEQTPQLVEAYQEKINQLPDSGFEAVALKQQLEEVVNEAGTGFGKLMLPLRVAITGMGFGPDLFQTMQLLGKKESQERIERALKEIQPG
ncbi:MAG: glutamate--tRNA ligase [Balneolales bacterium]|nr:glutamate--tRNA ligase [Balneolales bacterium]